MTGSGSPTWRHGLRGGSRKLAKKPDSVPVPEQLKSLARDVLAHVCAAYEALVSRDAVRARAVIDGDR